MKISTDQKLQLLVNNFETLKNDAEDNDESLRSLLSQVAAIDLSLALDLWQSLIEINIGYAKSDLYGRITSCVLYDISQKVGEVPFYDEVLRREKLKKYLFFESACIRGYDIIQHTLITNKLSYANELLELSYKNKNLLHSFADILCDDQDMGAIPDYYQPTSDAAIELLEFWIEKVKDGKERARLSTKLLALLEEE